MKKILSIALCAAAFSAFATSTEALLGEVGVTAITSSNQNTIVAVSYDDLAGGTGIVVSNFVKTTNLTVGDQLAIFNNGTGTEEGIYDTWVLRKNGNNVLYWEKNAKTYTVGAGGQLEVGTGTSASVVTNAVGTGIWLCRTAKPAKPFTFYIYGKPATTKTVRTKPEVWNLVGNPGQSAVTITNGIVQAANNDAILVPGAEGLVTYIYKKNATDCNGDKGAWCRAAVDAGGELGPAPIIEGGEGFWIMTAEAIDIKW